MPAGHGDSLAVRRAGAQPRQGRGQSQNVWRRRRPQGQPRQQQRRGNRAAETLTGKKGLVLGVANKRSLAWAIAKRASEAGAELALTFQGERLAENVRELAATLGRESLILPCDVAADDQVDALFAQIGESMGRLDFVVHAAAFAPREALSAPSVQTTPRRFGWRRHHAYRWSARQRAQPL